MLDADTCYQALLAHDPRFDGVFFVGVRSTGIYCRTVCPARKPRRESCTFHPSAAAAERAGFRPCLRCRPELAPGNARVDSAGRLAAAAALRIEDGALAEGSVAELAAEMGVSERHLRRVFRTEFGVAPVELAQTQRLLLARRLLMDTDLSITEVAFASGFGSLRRFNTLFQARYRLNPTQMRRSRSGAASPEALRCDLAYRPPLAWEAMLRFLGARAGAGVERVDGDWYARAVAVGKARGWVRVAPAPRGSLLRVEISASLAPAILPVLARVKRLFDLAADPAPIAERLGTLASARPGLRVPGAWDGFELAVRAILGQQVSVRAASTLAGRFNQAFGQPVETPIPGLDMLTPEPERVAAAGIREIAELGIIEARARAILALAEAVAGGRLRLEPGADMEAETARLREIPGIGEWTAQYVAMRALSWPDAFPHSDLALCRALGTSAPREALRAAEAWRPWRAYAAMHLWHSLEIPK